MSKKVIIGLSGGVDSAVAAARLLEQGYDVHAFFMKLENPAQKTAVQREMAPHEPAANPAGTDSGADNTTSVSTSDSSEAGDPTAQALADARRVAAFLGIPPEKFHVWELVDRFERGVIDPFVQAYASGLTPNPCVRCNRVFKFGYVVQRALREGFDYVATGHYARLEHLDTPISDPPDPQGVTNGGKNGLGLHYMNKARPFFPPLITAPQEASQKTRQTTQEKGGVSRQTTQEKSGMSRQTTQEKSGMSRQTTQEKSGMSRQTTQEKGEVSGQATQEKSGVSRQAPHEADRAKGNREGEFPRFRLRRGASLAKDQSYVLAGARAEMLAHAIFPLWEVRDKAETRAEAERRGLPVAHKRDSFDICFIHDGDTRGFLRGRLGGAQPGAIVDEEGAVVGQHQGAFLYTVGQRRGLHLPRPHADGQPRYVTGVDVGSNVVRVGPLETLDVHQIQCGRINWLVEPSFGRALLAEMAPHENESSELTVQFRAHSHPEPASFEINERDELLVIFPPEAVIRGVAPGQSLVVYQGDWVIAQAEIRSAVTTHAT